MTGKELTEQLGRQVILTLPVNKGLLRLPAVIVDARQVFGRIDYQVQVVLSNKEFAQQRVWVGDNQVKLLSEEVPS